MAKKKIEELARKTFKQKFPLLAEGLKNKFEKKYNFARWSDYLNAFKDGYEAKAAERN